MGWNRNGGLTQAQSDKLDKIAVGVKSNLNATTAPNANDDIAEGYSVGSTWIYSNVTYLCTNETKGAAVWVSTADMYYFDTWALLVAAISVAGSTYVNKFATVSNANGGAAGGTTYTAPATLTDKIVDGGSAIYKINAQGTTYSVTGQARTITHPALVSLVYAGGAKPTAAGYYVFLGIPSGGLPAGINTNDITVYNGTSWACFQAYSAAPDTVMVGTSFTTQLMYRKQFGTWYSASMLRGTVLINDVAIPNANPTVTGDIHHASITAPNGSASDVWITTVVAVPTNAVFIFSIENVGDQQLTNDIKPLVWTRVSTTQVRVYLEETGAVQQLIKLNMIVML